jgi:hypothetical protein
VDGCDMTPIDSEKKNLEMHVELSALREEAIHEVLDDHNEQLKELKESDEKLNSRINTVEENRNNQLIRWGMAIIVALLTTLGAIILKVLIPLFLGK